ncbi:GumC family protein [Zobellia galactanivorans]|uniref:GumC family protein n=1 Tax=Zobellia galactanivorans (strain DSM 12802 / CCUG 47099 / CIP 106680 / NCIMB 13871 / Dsij) TaxID=63186 RepID=UPI001C06F047|nr:polysaccharide biosynthesis tyrosine autokinase [Zobellia galactanivorans]MBU3028351.1 polysaccharide biosynthesis tyrosine autokinase [Zobellia galactanivorans]
MEEKNISDILSKYIKYWPLFAIGVVTCVAAVFLYIRYKAETQYNITSSILVKTKDTGNASIQSESIKSLGLIKNTTDIEDEIGIFTSTGIMEKVVANRSLNINFYIKGRFRDVEIYGEDTPVQILVDETDSSLLYDTPVEIKILENNRYELKTTINDQDLTIEHSFGDLVTSPFGTFTINYKEDTNYENKGKPLYFVIRNTDKVIENFLNNLSIQQVNKSGNLLNINFLCNNPKKGEDVVAGLIETYVEEMIKYENELAENTIKMIDNRLKLLSGEIQGVEKSVEEFKTKNDLTDVASNANLYIEQANDYRKLIADYQTEINVFDAIETYLQQGNSDTPIPASLSANDPSLTGMIDRYNETLLEKGQMSQSASSANPLIVNLDRTLNDLSKAIVENVRSAKNRLMIAQRNLQSNANKYQAQIAKVPSMERQLVDISRDKSTKEGLYLYLLQKREEEVLSLAAPVSSTRIVSLPKAGDIPVSPNKTSLYLGGLLLGLFLPFSIIYSKELLNNKVNSTEELANKVTAPILGEIAKSSNKSIFSNTPNDRTPIAELFRLLCFNLEYLKKTETNQTILVTSTIKGEGKTFIASNLANTLASNGEKVIALSFDLRMPQLMKIFDLADTPGLSDFIVKKEMELKEIVQKHPSIENLYLIGSGTEASQVGRLMLSKRIETLISGLKKEYDRIIIDTPPIGLISDAFALNAYIDSTIYVTRRGLTKNNHLKTLESIHKNGKLRNTMVLLNDSKEAEKYGYGKSN